MAASAPVRRLILLRHGQTEWNATDRMQGQLDTELTELGRTQAKEAAHELSQRMPLAVISSDLTRARDTADVLADLSGLTVALDPRLRETFLGDWQGLTHAEVDERAPGARVVWRRDATVSPPGGESRVDVAARSKPVVDELISTRDDWSDRPIVLVAHGGLIAALTAALLDLPVDRWPVLGGLANTSWVQLGAHGDRAEPSWTLDVWNASARVASDVL
ncbi:histidine phosphatase family protein [Antrihabitans cavernicola]|uniref:Histidine phosphatase family protein n=1 Tax=Antrihabitans cavernicola TaxID=2495913 RepID=A0A5A7SEA3_9NOCA|nr:histidine phosphatase family protein [Spelaeibacter cavernicola]KAA0022953.1 histidine phosphatase family protein [Spelaeibacter cavernicola]